MKMFMVAAGFIFLFEAYAVVKLDLKYRKEGEGFLSVEEFLARASLEDIIRLRYHSIASWLALGFMTIGSLLK